jgi:LuxR family maltose regulon positive regulatory protein
MIFLALPERPSVVIVVSDSSTHNLILVTKLYIPQPSPGLVPRPRLIAQMNEGVQRKLTLISAPAGFGKTTLLSEWASQRNDEEASFPSLAWLSLDEGDNDPARFWAYFIAALETLHSGVGQEALALLQASPSSSMETVLTALINSVAKAIPADFALVLDDYHVIGSQPIHNALSFFLEHLPPHMGLVIATRADPPLPLGRLRARGQMMELRDADLRFMPDEAAAFLNGAMRLSLTAEHVAALEARTEGWIAGLQLAALSMQGRDAERVSSFIDAFTGSQHYILEFLAEEVLQQQPEKIQTFLLQTSILERLSCPLCDAVVGRGVGEQGGGNAGQDILEFLEHTNLFVVPLDERRAWYRYHHLFADFLRARLAQGLGPQEIEELHRRACDWYERGGLASQAVRHALAAQDYERAARLIEQVAQDLLMRGELTTLSGWLQALPEDVLRSRRRLCLFQAWALLIIGQVGDAEALLQAATQEAYVPGVEAGADSSMLGEVNAMRAFLSVFRGDVSVVQQLSRQALEFLPQDRQSFSRGVVALNVGMLYMLSGDVEVASQAFAKAASIGLETGNILVALYAMCQQAEVQIPQGRLRQAATTYQKAIQLVTENGGALPVAGVAHIGMGEILREWNELESAVRHVQKGIELCEEWGELVALDGHIVLARVRQAQGDRQRALDAIQRAKSVARELDFTELDDDIVAAHQVRLWLAQGDVEAASRWAQGIRQLDLSTHPYHLREIENITLVRVLIAQGQVDSPADHLEEALQTLETLLQRAESLGRMGSVIEMLSLLAIAHQSQGRVDQSLSALERALSLAEPEGYMRMFLDLGQPMATLLRQAVSHQIAPHYVSSLLTAFDQEVVSSYAAEKPPTRLPKPAVQVPQHKSGAMGQMSAAHLLPEPLTERELEVLGLLAAGLSNQEIADELIVALSTVRSHVKNIYGKLGVSNRVQAVVRAQELNLVA